MKKTLITAAIFAAITFTATAQDAGQFFLQHEKEGIVVISPEIRKGRGRCVIFNTQNSTIDSVIVQWTGSSYRTGKVSGLSPILVSVPLLNPEGARFEKLSVYRAGAVQYFNRKQIEGLTMPVEVAKEAGL